MSSRYPLKELTVANVVGKQIKDVITPVSSEQLNIRILAEKEDPYLPDGTILRQIPQQGQKIKPYQSLFLVISKKPNPVSMPLVIGKQEADVMQQLKELHVHATYCMVPSTKPTGSCIAQFPEYGKPVDEHPIIIYSSQESKQLIVMPNFKQHTVQEALELLQFYPDTITHECISQSTRSVQHQYPLCTIIDQRPLPGSILTMDKNKPLHIQFLVDH